MNAINDERKDNDSTWQSAFVDMLPKIEQKLRFAFCRLEPEAREESIAESVARSLLAYCRLHEQGRAEVATPASLASFSSRQVRCGRLAAGRMNGKEPLSRYGQLNNGIQVEQLNGNWIDMLVDDKRAPVADQVAAKIDFRAWFETLTRTMRQIAQDMAFGCSTSEQAQKYGVTASRISQLRRSLEESWGKFHEEGVAAVA